MIAAETEMASRVVRSMMTPGELPTTETIKDSIAAALTVLVATNRISHFTPEDMEQLAKVLESQFNVYVPAMLSLDDYHDHIPWLAERRSEIDWKFWNRYRQYTENNGNVPPQAIWRLDQVTDQILERLENPKRPGAWDRRGMVVGQVQSGKTANYTALISKAADAGYKLIVVLAGIHNSLRSQTQLRLDEGFLGFDTQKRQLFNPDNSRFGVGMLNVQLYPVNSLTSSAERGDFNLRVAQQANIMYGTDPVLLVVKKNASVVNNLLKWATNLQGVVNEHGRTVVPNIPLLLIDDEADNASINTNKLLDGNGKPDPDLDPTKINGLIRKLLNSFEQSAYAAYTATPFANIFIPDVEGGVTYGQDLFPRSFIVNLQAPTNYLGPTQVFGVQRDIARDEADTEPLPIIRPVTDNDAWLPDKHKSGQQPGALPLSLKQAIRAFILTCAARQSRGQVKVHNSMLVHVTRFTAVQKRVHEQVLDEISFIKSKLRYGDEHAPIHIYDELNSLWEADFVPTMAVFDDPDLQPLTWDAVMPFIEDAAAKISILLINGTASDTLQYVEHPEGLNVICIGGDKLSRGLTLEGLSVSYYLRAARMYDTLMQMGRWFGYRPGYADLCRLYTTGELIGWYRDIATADEELRQMFEDMAAQNGTPENYGLRVRNHPDGLMITAAAKMRDGVKVRVSFANNILETVALPQTERENALNRQATDRLIRDLQKQYTYRQVANKETFAWDGVDAEHVMDFLNTYVTLPEARKVQSTVLRKYIKGRVADGELTKWTVVLISNKSADAEHHTVIAGLDVGLTERARLNENTLQDGRYSIRRLVSPSDEWIDLSPEEYEAAMNATKEMWAKKHPEGGGEAADQPKIPSGIAVRSARPPKRGLLLLYVLDETYVKDLQSGGPVVGFAISFPGSSNGEAAAVEYMVNNVYWQQEFEQDFGGEE